MRVPAMTNRPHRTIAPRPSASADRLSLAIVDPSSALRAGLPLLLSGVTVTGSYPTVEALLAARPAANIVLMDVVPESGVEPTSVRILARAGYLVCLYTFERRTAALARYIAAGARGVVSKADPVDALAGALSRIAFGGTAISNGFARGDAALPELTLRQSQILAGRARGETFHSIARRLDISERTAQDHWSAIARRFETFLRSHSPADLERSLGLDSGVAPLEYDEVR
jgi:two-component system nitrate/nitrite response regulator NarL